MRIVLVRPSHPGNIGASARAMKAMGLTDLHLVAPKNFPHPEALTLATHAQDIIQNTVITSTIPEALNNIHVVYATSANHRQVDLPLLTARQAVAQMQQESGNSAVLFGTENHGLSNEELSYAHYLVHIPTHQDYHSLNLAQAVQIIAYEWQQLQQVRKITQSPVETVSVDQLEFFYQRLQTLLIDLKILNPQQPGQMMIKLRQLFNRSFLKSAELKILQNILGTFEKLKD